MPAPRESKDSPKLQTYASALYELMTASAKSQVVSGTEYSVWNGFLTKACHEIGCPVGVERRVTRLLEQLDAIQILQRGSRVYPSVVALLSPPTADQFAQIHVRALTDRPTGARLSLEIQSIKETLGGVNLQDVLMNFEERIAALELQLKQVLSSK